VWVNNKRWYECSKFQVLVSILINAIPTSREATHAPAIKTTALYMSSLRTKKLLNLKYKILMVAEKNNPYLK
jgi:hypothetical protein